MLASNGTTGVLSKNKLRENLYPIIMVKVDSESMPGSIAPAISTTYTSILLAVVAGSNPFTSFKNQRQGTLVRRLYSGVETGR